MVTARRRRRAARRPSPDLVARRQYRAAWSAGRRLDENPTQPIWQPVPAANHGPGREDHPMYSFDGKHLAFLHQPSEDSMVLRIMDVRRARSPISRRPAHWQPNRAWTSRGARPPMACSTSPADSRPANPPRRRLSPSPVKRLAVMESPTHSLSPVGRRLLIFPLRHAKLWRAWFTQAGQLAPAEPLGEDPAMYLASARWHGPLHLGRRSALALTRWTAASPRLAYRLHSADGTAGADPERAHHRWQRRTGHADP